VLRDKVVRNRALQAFGVQVMQHDGAQGIE